jgi:uncharacterized membrane protein YagU involved in acid resistance
MDASFPALSSLGLPEFAVLFAIFFAIPWSFLWKGIALWKAARNGSKVWYVVLLLINTLGILEILYIFVFSKKQPETVVSG